MLNKSVFVKEGMQLWGWQSVASKWRNWDHFLDRIKAKPISVLIDMEYSL